MRLISIYVILIKKNCVIHKGIEHVEFVRGIYFFHEQFCFKKTNMFTLRGMIYCILFWKFDIFSSPILRIYPIINYITKVFVWAVVCNCRFEKWGVAVELGINSFGSNCNVYWSFSIKYGKTILRILLSGSYY